MYEFIPKLISNQCSSKGLAAEPATLPSAIFDIFVGVPSDILDVFVGVTAPRICATCLYC